MIPTQDIKDVLYQTVHQGKKPVKQIADEIGISSNYLYRCALPDDESGVKFPVQYLIPLMKSTNDYSLLKHIANLSGYILAKIPRMKNSKMDEVDMLDEYQYANFKALQSLKVFFETPTYENYRLVEAALRDVMERNVACQKYAEKKLAGQIEMELSE